MVAKGILGRWTITRFRATVESYRYILLVAFEPPMEKFRAVQIMREQARRVSVNLGAEVLLVTGRETSLSRIPAE